MLGARHGSGELGAPLTSALDLSLFERSVLARDDESHTFSDRSIALGFKTLQNGLGRAARRPPDARFEGGGSPVSLGKGLEPRTHRRVGQIGRRRCSAGVFGDVFPNPVGRKMESQDGSPRHYQISIRDRFRSRFGGGECFCAGADALGDSPRDRRRVSPQAFINDYSLHGLYLSVRPQYFQAAAFSGTRVPLSIGRGAGAPLRRASLC